MTGDTTPNFLKVLTLDEFKTQITEGLTIQTGKTQGFIVTLNGRIDTLKASNGSEAEITRLQGLVVLHTNNLTNLINSNIDALAQEKLDQQTKRIDEINRRTNRN